MLASARKSMSSVREKICVNPLNLCSRHLSGLCNLRENKLGLAALQG